MYLCAEKDLEHSYLFLSTDIEILESKNLFFDWLATLNLQTLSFLATNRSNNYHPLLPAPHKSESYVL